MPYGCQAMHFKPAHNPAQVFSSSGMDCQLFTPKSTDHEGENPLPLSKRVT